MLALSAYLSDDNIKRLPTVNRTTANVKGNIKSVNQLNEYVTRLSSCNDW